MLARTLWMLVMSAALACSNGSTGSSSPENDASADATLAVVVPASFTKVVVYVNGGGFTEGAEGSRCRAPDDTFTLDLATKALGWNLCRPQGTPDAGDLAFYDYAPGNKTLTDAELASLMTPIRALMRATFPARCVADSADETITFTTSAGETVLRSGSHACSGSYPVVTNLDNVVDAFDALTAH